MRAVIVRIALITLLFSTASIVIQLSIQSPSEALGSSRCPNGYHKSPSGDCEKVKDLPNDQPRCPNGYHRSPDGDCERVADGSPVSDSRNNDGDDDSSSNNDNAKNTDVIPSTQQQRQPSSTNALEESQPLQPQQLQQKPLSSLGTSQTNNTQAKNEATKTSLDNDFLTYQNPALGISIQFPPYWQIDEKKNHNINLNQEKGVVYITISSDDLDSSISSSSGNTASANTQLAEYASSQISERLENKEDFTLIESSPTTISGDNPAYKALYTFVKDEDETNPGKINKVFRIWTIIGDKVYTIAYVAEIDKYSIYLPIAQQMIDSFDIGGSNDINAKQIGSSDRSQSPPELKPKTSFGGNSEAPSTSEPEPPRGTDFAMKVQLEPHENEFARHEGRYQVSDFAIAISNSSKLCPVSNCEFDLDGGEMSGEVTPGERALDGKLRIDTGGSTKIMDLYADLQTVEERQQDGENVQVIQGELITSLGDINKPNYQSLINGTLVPDGDDFTLELTGTGESPFTYT